MLIMVSLIFFAVAATLGFMMGYLHFTRRAIPMALALSHGTLVIAGLVTLGLVAFRDTGVGQAQVALYLLLATAGVGLYLFSFQLRKLRLSTTILLTHATLAVVGLFYLIAVIVTRQAL